MQIQDSFTVRLLRPNTDVDKEYTILDGDNVQTVKDNPTWRLRAPGAEPVQISTFSFEFIQWPKDANSGQLAEVEGNMWDISFKDSKENRIGITSLPE